MTSSPKTTPYFSKLVALQHSIMGLAAANAHAYQTGYQAAYSPHQDLTKRHIAELEQPRIKLARVVGFA